MRKLILALLALCFSNVALAQSFPKPPDVPNYVVTTPVYTTDGTANRYRDARVITPPAYSYELPNIPIPSAPAEYSKRIAAGSFPNSEGGFCTIYSMGGTDTSCQQAKLRLHIDFSHMLPDDPIRNYGQPGQSHLHCFFGAGSTNAYSTQSSIRKHGLDSTSAGTDANATAYWYPCMVKVNPFGDGKNYALKADYIVVYYVSNDPSEMPKAAHLASGLRYVFGYEMDDDWAWLQTILDGYNTTIGHNRYSVSDRSGHRFAEPSFVCAGATAVAPYSVAPGYSRYIKLPNGSDPYNGTCNAGQQYWIAVHGSDCWDGVNLWSPGGYKHLIPRIFDNDRSEFVCPTNYYRVPSLEFEIQFTQKGWADRQTWELASDLAKRASTGGTYTTVPPGLTFHTDWMNGWDQDILLKWNHNCLGVDGNVPHQCFTNVISATERFYGTTNENGAGGRSPQVDLTSLAHANPTDPGLMLIPPAWAGSLGGMHLHAGLTPTPLAGIATEGDSISATWGGNWTGIYQNARLSQRSCNLAQSGSHLSQVIARQNAALACKSSVQTLLIGANDLGTGAVTTTTQYINDLFAYTDSLRAMGVKVAVGTILPRYASSNPTFTSTFNSQRATINSAIRSAVGVHIDAVIDFANDPTMGPDAAAQNTTYYMADGLHPTDGCGWGCGGQGKMAQIAAPTIDTLLGITAPTHLCSDGVTTQPDYITC